MVRVLDTISIHAAWHPRRSAAGARVSQAGMEAVIDAGPELLIRNLIGASVTIVRPDGSSITRLVDSVDVVHGVPSLFFAGTSTAEVPRGSEIQWSPGIVPGDAPVA